MFSFWTSAEDPPPQPEQSAVFVIRNGRYEPQNYMPLMPRTDHRDFDGFGRRRLHGGGFVTMELPEMQQADLLSSPVCIRRGSIRAKVLEPGRTPSSGSASPPPLVQISLTLTFDAAQAGSLSMHTLVTEREENADSEVAKSVGEGSDDCSPVSAASLMQKRRIRLLEREKEPPNLLKDPEWSIHDSEEGPEEDSLPIHTTEFDRGLNQVWESPSIEISKMSDGAYEHDPATPHDIPIVIVLQTVEEESPIQYTFISLQKVAPSPRARPEDAVEDRWNAQVIGNKLQVNDQCFDLHEVFGTTSKEGIVTEAESNTECVICLTEPRDTAVLPCRHMCFCSYCAGIVRLQCAQCPICRQRVSSMLQFQRKAQGQDEAVVIAAPN